MLMGKRVKWGNAGKHTELNNQASEDWSISLCLATLDIINPDTKLRRISIGFYVDRHGLVRNSDQE